MVRPTVNVRFHKLTRSLIRRFPWNQNYFYLCFSFLNMLRAHSKEQRSISFVSYFVIFRPFSRKPDVLESVRTEIPVQRLKRLPKPVCKIRAGLRIFSLTFAFDLLLNFSFSIPRIPWVLPSVLWIDNPGLEFCSKLQNFFHSKNISADTSPFVFYNIQKNMLKTTQKNSNSKKNSRLFNNFQLHMEIFEIISEKQKMQLPFISAENIFCRMRNCNVSYTSDLEISLRKK